jgi:hypothetical protein
VKGSSVGDGIVNAGTVGLSANVAIGSGSTSNSASISSD